MKSEFDKYARNYDSILNNTLSDVINIDGNYFSEYKVKELFTLCKEKKLHPIKILNFGCGTGKSEEFFIKYFPHSKIYGYDVSKESINIAKKRGLQKTYFFTLRAKQELKDDFFDIIFISNVFHHIDHALHLEIFQNLYKKLKKGASLIIFEHNTLNPLTLKIVRECELDKEANLLSYWYTKKKLNLAGFKDINVRFILFIPPILRKLLFMEKFLRWLPIGAQYYVTAKKT